MAGFPVRPHALPVFTSRVLESGWVRTIATIRPPSNLQPPLVTPEHSPIMFLSGISLICFGTSYLVTLALEVSRLFFRLPVRLVVMLAFAAMGLALHTIYLALRAQSAAGTGDPLSSWHDWFLMAAWILAAAYLILALTRPQTLVGLFMLPVVLGLVGVAALFDKKMLFPH